ncbi:MAG: exodeoxyribonuclease III [Ignavibacteria bacterium]|nr:exodeoxyribonuclease III [Ignavibacteria bacterium]
MPSAKKKRSGTLLIYSWNVNGIRAVQNKGFMEWFGNSAGDIICLQETKAQPDQIDESVKNIKGYESHFFSAEKKGYSGVCIYTKVRPESIRLGLGNEYFDTEGRAIIADYGSFVLANCYFPNGGRGPERVKYKLDFYDELFYLLDKNYRDRKGIIVTGDFNTAHKEIDLAEPEKNMKNSGFLPEEREWIDNLLRLGYVDVFRKFHKEGGLYTFWDQVTRKREKNLGWRIDYFMVSEDFAGNVVSSEIYPHVMGSDHCPVSIKVKI